MRGIAGVFVVVIRLSLVDDSVYEQIVRVEPFLTRIRIDAVLALEVVELVLALRIHDAALGLPRSAPVRAPLPLHAVQEGRQRRLLLLLLGFRLFAPLLLLGLGFDGLLLLRRGRRPLPLEHELRERLGVVASELLELGRVDIARLEREQNLLNLVLVLLRLVPVVARFERRGLASLHQVAHVVVGGHVLVFSGVSGGFTPRRSLAGHHLDRDGLDKLSSLKLRREPLGISRIRSGWCRTGARYTRNREKGFTTVTVRTCAISSITRTALLTMRPTKRHKWSDQRKCAGTFSPPLKKCRNS